jgi:hypothetical protein
VIIWDILEVEHCLFSKAIFAFDDDRPKDATKGLFRQLILCNCMWGACVCAYLDFSTIQPGDGSVEIAYRHEEDALAGHQNPVVK